jgi:hypothetical protein
MSDLIRNHASRDWLYRCSYPMAFTEQNPAARRLRADTSTTGLTLRASRSISFVRCLTGPTYADSFETDCGPYDQGHREFRVSYSKILHVTKLGNWLQIFA